MGYMRHHAIIVSGGLGSFVRDAHERAEELGLVVTSIKRSIINHYDSFLVVPDGSKAGWPEDTEGDIRRDAFVAYLRDQVYDDGSTPIEWVEVQYGDDDRETRAIRSSDADTSAYRVAAGKTP